MLSFIYLCLLSSSKIFHQMLTEATTESLDSIRTLRMAGYGLLIMGPSLHFWFNFVSKILPKRDVVTTLKKIFMGQTIYGPIMATVFFSINAGLQGKSLCIFTFLCCHVTPHFFLPSFCNKLIQNI